LFDALAPGQDVWNASFNLGCCQQPRFPRSSQLCLADDGILINPALVSIVEKHHLKP
jgi:hypothetical protein